MCRSFSHLVASHAWHDVNGCEDYPSEYGGEGSTFNGPFLCWMARCLARCVNVPF